MTILQTRFASATAGKMRAILLVLIACALLLPGGEVSAADEVKPENQEDDEGYPDQEGRRIGGPTDVEADLDNSFPQKDSADERACHSIPSWRLEWSVN